MASNVLTATIKVNTQGVKQSFQETGTAAKKAAVDIKGIGGFATGAIAETKQVVKSLTAEISQLDATMLRSRGGQVLASELRAAKIELKALEAQAQISGGTGKNIASQLFSQVRQLAFILPGIGVAGIFNVAFEGAQKLVEGIFDVGEESKASAEKVKELRKAMDEAFSSSAKEATEVLSLAAVLKNETETRERRLGAIKELQRIQPDIFSGLKLEGDAVVGLDNAYKAYVANLRTVIAAKLVQAEIEQKLTELLKLQGVTLSKAQEGGIAAFKKLGDSARAADEKIGELAKPTKLKAFVDAFGKIRGTDFDFGADTEKRIKTLTDDVDGLAKKLQEFSLGIKVDIPKEKIAKVFEGIRVGIVDGLNNTVKLLELNPTPLSLPFQLALDEAKLSLQFSNVNEELRGKLQQFALKTSVVPLNIQTQITADTSKVVPILVKELNDSIKKLRNAPLAVARFDLSSVLDFDNAEFLDKWKESFAKMRGVAIENFSKIEIDFIKSTARMQTALEATVAVLQPAFEALFNSFTSNARGLDAFLKALGQTVKQLVVKLLTAAAIAAVIKAILGSKGGSFSSIFTNLIGFKEKGGPVQGGKKYVVNERGEEIFKSNSGKSFLIKGGPQFFIPPTSGKIITHSESNKILSSSREKVSNSIKNVYSNIVKNISGHRATGGNVTHGNQYVVNENGTEIFQTTAGKAILIQGGRQLFTPPSAGKIIPHLQTTKILNSLRNVKTSTSRVINNISSNIRNISGNRISGGGVIGGNTYMTNEGGAEIFIPNTGQAIRVSPQSGAVKSGGMAISVDINGVLRGNDIVYAISNITRQQGRLK